MESSDMEPLSSSLDKAIAASVETSASASTKMSQDEARSLEAQKDQLLAEQIKDIGHYRELRKKYAYKVFVFMCVWSGLTFAILMVKRFMAEAFHLNDTVLVTLTGGTTVSVIGLVGFIIQGLFNSKNNNSIK